MNFVHSFNRKQIIFNQRTILAIVQVKLGHNIAIGCAHKCSGVFKRLVNEDDTTCVLTQTTHKTFNLLGNLPDFGIIFCHFIYKLLIRRPVIFFVSIKGLVKSAKHTTVCHNHRSKILCDININTQTTTGSQNCGLRFFSTKSRNIGHSIIAIYFSQMVENSLSTTSFNINVNIKNRYTVRIKKTPSKSFGGFPLGINLRNPKQIKKNKTDARTTPATHESTCIPTLLNNLLQIQIICRPMSFVNLGGNPSHFQTFIDCIINLKILQPFIRLYF